jgi:hypothetical protein
VSYLIGANDDRLTSVRLDGVGNALAGSYTVLTHNHRFHGGAANALDIGAGASASGKPYVLVAPWTFHFDDPPSGAPSAPPYETVREADGGSSIHWRLTDTRGIGLGLYPAAPTEDPEPLAALSTIANGEMVRFSYRLVTMGGDVVAGWLGEPAGPRPRHLALARVQIALAPGGP